MAKTNKKRKKRTNIKTYIEVIAVVVIILAVGILFLSNSKQAPNNSSNNKNDLNNSHSVSPTSVGNTTQVISNSSKSTTVNQTNSTVSSSYISQNESNYIYCIGGFLYAPLSGVYYTSINSDDSISAWKPTTNYPVGIGSQSCISSNGDIYCLSGSTIDSTFYLNATSSGTTKWQSTTPYPLSLYASSCISFNDSVYCIGGTYYCGNCYDWTNANLAYYASFNQTGIGVWKTTSTYPLYVVRQSCVEANGYIYCIGGYNATIYGEEDYFDYNQTYFAPITSKGIGNWTATTPYPIKVGEQSCATNGLYIYCVGGTTADNSSKYANYVGDYVFYAPITSKGIGNWVSTTPYPVYISDTSCVISSNYLYCIGGSGQGTSNDTYYNLTYYSPITNSGVGGWISGRPYPIESATASCVVV